VTILVWVVASIMGGQDSALEKMNQRKAAMMIRLLREAHIRTKAKPLFAWFVILWPI